MSKLRRSKRTNMEGILVEDYKIKNYYKVDITHINNPHSFYVRPTDCKYLKMLEKPGEPAQISNLSHGCLVVYRSRVSNKFVRGNISSINNSDRHTFNIFAIDYGYFDKYVGIEEIFKPETLDMVPPLARHCQLGNCVPCGDTFTNADTEAMKFYIGNVYCVMLVQAFKGVQMIVKLQNNFPNDIATMLAITHNTRFQRYAGISFSRVTSIQPFMPKFSPKNVEINNVLHICMLRAKSVIPKTHYVADINDFEMYIKTRKIFTDYCQLQKVMTEDDLEIGKPIAHKPQFEIHYERAVIRSISKTSCKVLIYLIDTGETKEAAPYQMKKIQCMKYFETPGIAFQCTFEESTKIAHKLPENVIPGYETWIKIKEIGDPNIVEIVPKPVDCQ